MILDINYLPPVDLYPTQLESRQAASADPQSALHYAHLVLPPTETIGAARSGRKSPSSAVAQRDLQAVFRAGGEPTSPSTAAGNGILLAAAAAAADGFWPENATPRILSDPDSAGVEIGLEFKTTVSGFIRGVQFYKSAANSGVHDVHLWNGSGQLLATARAADANQTGWQTALFAAPMAVAANTTYVASYYAPQGRYSVDENYFGGSLTKGSLTAPANAGVYSYGAASRFPTSRYAASNYWVDVVFGENAGGGDQPVAGTCGTSNGARLSSKPSAGLCGTGIASVVSGSGPWSWSCAGSNGGTTAQCSASVQSSAIDGACGTSSGARLTSKPNAGLCSAGTASAVSGSGPWTWNCASTNGGTMAQCATLGACVGNVTPAPTWIVLPPDTPQPQEAGDIAGVVLQNPSASGTAGQVFTFGQFFAAGAVRPTDRLVARTSGDSLQAQMDPLALWADGSVKFAAITLSTNVCGGSSLPLMLSKAQAGDPPFGTTPLNLAATTVNLSVTLNFTGGAYTGQKTVDLGAALRASLAGNADYWLRGPLATQARVDVPLAGGSLHLTADVTVHSDGNIVADVQFNNDIATVVNGSQANSLPPLAYTATITLQGKPTSYTVSQLQYQDWHAVVATDGVSTLNAQHDVAYLQHGGAMLPYDRTTGVNNSLLQSYATMANGASFGKPLASNGVTEYMPMAGGRGDLGYTTQYDTVWLLTGDARAAAIGLAQGDTGGAVPWNIKLANGRWLTPDENPQVWIDERGNPTIKNAINMTKWGLDKAHQPNLAYVPYLMTGRRWYLDRLNAQAAFGLSYSWPVYRCQTAACNTVVNGSDEVRAQAWSMRELVLAANVGKTGSWEQGYFAKVVADNWSYLKSQQARLAAAEGEATGYVPGDNRIDSQTCPFQQDFLTGIAVLASLMGDANAKQFVGWQRPWLSGRFIGSGMNPNDGCAYQLQTANPSTNVPYTTWAAIERATIAAGASNGNRPCGDNYPQVARSALGAALTLYPGDANLQQALRVLNASGAQYLTQPSFQADPTYNIVPRQ